MDDVVTDPVSGDENAAVFGGDIPKHTGGERCLNLNQLYNMKQIKTLGDNHQLTVKDIKTNKEFLINKEDAFAETQAAIDAVVAGLPVVPTTITIPITAANWNAIDSAIFELLPVPAAGTYYDSCVIKLEFYPGNVNFVSAETKFSLVNGDNSYDLSLGALKDGYDAYWVIDCNQANAIFSTSAEGTTSKVGFTENYPGYSQIGLFCGGAISTGNGTGKAIVTYTVRTFGA